MGRNEEWDYESLAWIHEVREGALSADPEPAAEGLAPARGRRDCGAQLPDCFKRLDSSRRPSFESWRNVG